MKAGIAVDNYKLPVFRKRLKEAGYAYQDGLRTGKHGPKASPNLSSSGADNGRS
jgi:hypothetical protein